MVTDGQDVCGLNFRVLAAVASVLALVTLFGATPAGAAPQEITVGTLYAGQGPFAVSSVPQYQGLQFWADQGQPRTIVASATANTGPMREAFSRPPR